MYLMKTALLSLILSCSLPLFASELPAWCKTRPWNAARNYPLDRYFLVAEQMERMDIVQMVWSEILQKPDSSVGPALIMYLGKSESDEELRNYYKSLIYFGFDLLSVDEGVAKWPQRPAYTKKKWTLKKLCELFVKSGGSHVVPREPQGKKPRSKK